MSNKQDLLRNLPKIDALLEGEEAVRHIKSLGRAAVVDICRKAVEEAKSLAVDKGEVPDISRIERNIAAACRSRQSDILGRVINGTGVMLHTNMGRSPLGKKLFEEIARAVGGYCNLEINVLE